MGRMRALGRVIAPGIRELALFFVIVLLSFFIEARSGGCFLTPSNIGDMLAETAVLAILAVGMMLVIITGGIDLSVGAVMALSAMTAVTLLKHNRDMHPAAVVLTAVAVGLLCGLISGFLVSRIGILPIIATLGMMNIFRGTTYLVSGGGWVLQNDMSKEFMQVATGRTLGINNLVFIAVLVYVAAFLFTNYFRPGRRVYAVGNSIESARVSGIDVKNTLLFVYAAMGALAGLGGVLYVCKYAVAQGETASGYEMNVIAACVLGGVSISGGTGKVQGVLLGALLLGILNNALPLINVSPFWQQAIRGLIIIVSVIINALIQRSVTRKALERRAEA